MAQFEYKTSTDGKTYWVFRASGNNEIVAVSEGYNSKAAAKNGVLVLKQQAAGATEQDLT